MDPAPLQSKVGNSDPAHDQRLIADRAMIAATIDARDYMHTMRGGRAMVMRVGHSAFEGSFATGPYLRLGLCVGPPVRLVQHSGSARLEGVWRPGTVVVGPGDREGVARCGETRMIGLMVAPGVTPLAEVLDGDRIEMLATGIHRDGLLAAVLTALYEEADVHGASTAFFEHGLELVLRRLAELRERPKARMITRPLGDPEFALLQAYVDERLGEDLSVAEMADVAGMEPSAFTKSLAARTGQPPYAWLTRRRMDRAISLLSAGRSVIRTANALGYANPAKFAAAFRRVKGFSPSKVLAR